MAEEEIQVSEEEAFSKWMEGLEAPTEEDDTQEEDALQVAKSTRKVVTEFIVEQKTDEMVDKWTAQASEDAKRLFAIYRRGDEDPKQLKAIMELATVKAAEAATAPEVQEAAEKRAEQIAKDNYGVGPIGNASPTPEPTPEQYFDAKRSEAKKSRDTHKMYELFRDLPAGSPAPRPD